MFTQTVTNLAATPRPRLLRLAALPVVGVLAATSAADASPQSVVAAQPESTSTAIATAAPAKAEAALARAVTLRTRVVKSGLDIPWDVTVLPGGSWVFTERDRKRILIRRPNGATRVLINDPAGFINEGETGLMSIAADPRFERNARVYTCTGFRTDGRNDVRIHAWRLNARRTDIRRVDTLLTGIQMTSGRHGGCRIRFDNLGRMYVGTGDAAVGTNPQNLRSLNGKVLRLNRYTGNAAAGNPFKSSSIRKKRFIWTYGHRNVQGLSMRPGRGMWSVEHGTYRDDEVNRLVRGGNYGWNPVPGYNESRPMTDHSLPGKQISARWRSGNPTIATSGAVWVRGREWGRYQGTLAVCTLVGERLIFIKFNKAGQRVWVVAPPALNGRYGRLRSVVQTANRDLLITTANGGGADRIVRVHPS